MGESPEPPADVIDDAYRVHHVDGVTYIAHHQHRTYVAVDHDTDGTIQPLPFHYDAFERAIRNDDWRPTQIPVADLPRDVQEQLADCLSNPVQPTPTAIDPPQFNG